jgi:hypothetical protein
MENIFTQEEANKLVTYGDLLTILNSIVNDIGKSSIDYTDTLQKHTFDIIDKLTDHIVEIRNDAEYKRIRDMTFVLNMISQVGHFDNGLLCKSYNTWCEEYDRLNKLKNDTKEKTNG